MASPSPLNFHVRFAAGTAVDEDRGTLIGVSVAEIGVATGHFVALDQMGQIIGVDDYDIPGTARRIPLCADQETLDTIVQVGSKLTRVKAREDHDDSIGSRAGYSNNFRIEGGKAVCDLTVFDSYQNRATFFETAQKTPEMIGLSGHFKFIAEIIGDQAFMRVTDIEAVDIVDEGALTHTGLFRAKATPLKVDNPENIKTRKKLATKMSNAPKVPPANEAPANDDKEAVMPDMPDLETFKAMCEQVGAYAAAIKGNNSDFESQLSEALAAIQPVVVPTKPEAPAPVKGPATNPDAHVPDPAAAFTAILGAMKALGAKVTKMETDQKKNLTALGIKAAAAPSTTSPETKAEVKTENAPLNFLELKAKIQKEENLKPGAAAEAAMKRQPDAYRTYLKGMGVYDHTKDARLSRTRRAS